MRDQNRHRPSDVDPGLKYMLEISDGCNMVTRTKFCEALNMIDLVKPKLQTSLQLVEEVDSIKLDKITEQIEGSLLWIVRKYSDKIKLKDADRKPKASKKKSKRMSAGSECKSKTIEIVEEWHGLPPWDPSIGGDGCPKFLCDVMIEGLAKHLRCVGIDAAIPYLKKPDARDLIEQTQKEKRVLLTRDAKMMRYEYLIKNQIYRIRSLLKNDQLLEVINTFQLTVSEDQLMSRCTKCNGKFIQKPLTIEEAVQAAKGFQVIPSCLFEKNLEFWQCMDCNQLYWEGTQYHNAVQKFIDVCKLNDQT